MTTIIYHTKMSLKPKSEMNKHCHEMHRLKNIAKGHRLNKKTDFYYVLIVSGFSWISTVACFRQHKTHCVQTMFILIAIGSFCYPNYACLYLVAFYYLHLTNVTVIFRPTSWEPHQASVSKSRTFVRYIKHKMLRKIPQKWSHLLHGY